MFYYSGLTDTSKIKFLNESELIHSMIENIAYFIHSIIKSGVIYAIKYLERFMNAFKLFKTNQQIFIIDDETINLFNLMKELKLNFRNRTFSEKKEYVFSTYNSNEVIIIEKDKINNLYNLMIIFLTKYVKLNEIEKLKFEGLNSTKFKQYIYCLFLLLSSTFTDLNTNINIKIISNKNPLNKDFFFNLNL